MDFSESNCAGPLRPAVYEVVYPLGKATAEPKALAPAIIDLNGKTICEFWSGDFRGDTTFPKIRDLLKARFPDVKIVPYTELPMTLDSQQIPNIVAKAKELECDAFIGGNGG